MLWLTTTSTFMRKLRRKRQDDLRLKNVVVHLERHRSLITAKVFGGASQQTTWSGCFKVGFSFKSISVRIYLSRVLSKGAERIV